MSNNKPTAVATIGFFPNKHIEVKLTGITGITPRTLAIAENLLARKYREMRGQAVADSHKKARDDAAAAVVDEEKKEAEYHIQRDKELAESAKAKLDGTRVEKPESTPEPEVKTEEKADGGSSPSQAAEAETSEEVNEAANDETEDSEAVPDDKVA